MKKIFMVVGALCITLSAIAQQVKVQMGEVTGTAQQFVLEKNSGKLQINLGQVTVEGHNGNGIIFSSEDNPRNEDERAKGLRSVNSLGLEDNTGLGINVTDTEGIIQVYQLKKMNSPKIKILVPKGVIVAFAHESQYNGKAIFRNMENEIEVSTNYNSILLENITGPVTVKTVYGSVDAVFSANVKGPISIVSIYGHVDVALPVTIKANMKMSTSHGEIFVSPDFKIDIAKEGDLIKYSGERVTGKINGGGMNIDFRSDYSKIYFRKK